MAKATKSEKLTIEEISSQEDFQKFYSMLIVTEQADKQFDDLSTDAQRDIVNKFYLWKEKGSPKAEMPKLKDDKEDEIVKLYRVKHRGEQYIWYIARTDDGPKYVGREELNTYVQEEERDEKGQPTGNMTDTNIISNTEYRYTMPYTKDIGEKLLRQSFKYTDDPLCYFIVAGNKVRVSDPETEFNVDGKQMQILMQQAPGIKGRRV